MSVFENVQVIADKNELTRKVHRIYSTDILSRVNHIKENDLIITTGYDVANNLNLIDKTIEKLVQKKIACLAVQIGVYLDSIPNEFIEKCRELMLPLLILSENISSADIIESFYTKNNNTLINTYECNLKFLKLVLQEKGIPEIACLLSENIQLPVRIFDEYFNLLFHHGFTNNFELLDGKNIKLEYEKLKSKNILDRALENNQPYYITSDLIDNISSQVICPIKANSKCYGYLSIITNEKDIIYDQNLVSYLKTAATVSAIELLKEKAVWNAQEKISGGFFDNLLDGNIKSIKHLQRRSTQLNLDYSKHFTIFVLEIDNFLITKNMKDEIELQKIKKSVLSYVKSNLYFQSYKTILKFRKDKLCILLQLDKNTNKNEINELAKKLQTDIKDNLDISISIGIGKYHIKMEEVPIAYKEAEKALSIGKKLWKQGYIVFYEDLGVYQLFANVENKNELRNYYINTIHPLLKYDREYNSELMMTLEAFLDSNGSIKDTSENLFLHRHTLRYRLKKIKDITNLDPQDLQDRFRLQMGIVVSHLLSDGVEDQ